MLAVSVVLIFLIHQSHQTGEKLPAEVISYVDTLGDICSPKMGVAKGFGKSYDFSNKSPEAMCYIKCLFIEGKWGSEDDTIFYDDLITRADPAIKDIVTDMINKCRDIPPGSQDCEKMYNFMSCARDVHPEYFYMP